jgi:putative component of membrane protein insertase Oxa1/YidC/SpoIIIJ protein YidD
MKIKNLFFIFLILLSMYFSTFKMYAQQVSNTLNHNVISVAFEQITPNSILRKRKFLSLKNKSIAQKLNPFLYIGASLLFVYQNIVSEQIQAECVYQLSCSEFTKKSIEKNGFIKGTLAGFHQLSNCFQGAIYEHPVYTINEFGKINNTIDEQIQK